MLAEMLHVPLGVLAFICACGAALILIRWAGTSEQTDPDAPHQGSRIYPHETKSYKLSRPVWLAPLIIILALILGVLYQPRPQEIYASAPQTWDFPVGMVAEPWPLSPEEENWLSNVGDSSATRWRFDWQELSGALLFVSSTSWRAQHRPESCFEVFGLSVKDSQTHMLAENFPLRTLSLHNQKGLPIYSAAYWFQNKDYVTDDYGTRMWADLASERQTWVMVTVLFDRPYDPLEKDLLAFYPVLRQTIARSLEGGVHP
jgi:exosortase O